MSDARKIVILPGDGIGPEIIAEAEKVLQFVNEKNSLGLTTETCLFGGAAYDAHGSPLPAETLEACRAADAILLGAIGGPSLKAELVAGLDLMILRELTGGIYFGEPRGIEERNGERFGFNTMVYGESDIRQIAVRGFESAMQRNKRLCSVDKANVLEVSELWREIVVDVSKDYPEVELSHMYVDNAAMQLVRAPKQFDVIVTGNIFGDILSDAAAMLTGSIGMLPSASLDASGKGMYEPVHGSAPDIAGKGVANPLATILSVAMMLRYTLDESAAADAIEAAVSAVISDGYRCQDISTGAASEKLVGTESMGEAVMAALNAGINA